MSAKEKAKELVDKFKDDPFTSQLTTAGAKQCALIAVDEIIDCYAPLFEKAEMKNTFWIKVKEEIERL